MKEKEKIDVPVDVLHALKEVRDEGLYNMFSATEVVTRMSQLGYHKEYMWMVDIDEVRVDMDRYMKALTEMGDSIALADKLERS